MVETKTSSSTKYKEDTSLKALAEKYKNLIPMSPSNHLIEHSDRARILFSDVPVEPKDTLSYCTSDLYISSMYHRITINSQQEV